MKLLDFKKINNSFKIAFKGIGLGFKYEQNLKIMAIVAIIVIFLMFYFPTTKIEKIILIMTIFFVLSLEFINTTIEKIMDFLHPNYHQKVKIIKDINAGGVLIACLGATIIGIIIFGKYLLK